MSVQAGIWNFDGAPVERESLGNISRVLADYGPDGEALYLDENLGILYRPFHTTEESRRETQPFEFGHGNILTWTGRLDNRDELVSQLGEPLDAASTDVAIVAAA